MQSEWYDRGSHVPNFNRNGQVKAIKVSKGSNGNRRLSFEFATGTRTVTISPEEANLISGALHAQAVPASLETFVQATQVVA